VLQRPEITSTLAASENGSYTIKIPEKSPSGTSLVNMSVADDNVGQQQLCVSDGRELHCPNRLQKFTCRKTPIWTMNAT